MRTIAAFIAGIITALAITAGAAVTTITTTAPDDARLVVAFGKYLALGRNATQAEIVADLRRYMVGVVVTQEDIAARAALVPATPINPS